jgi:tRNA(Arg) A34 adenosine deaminase TadA
MNIESLLESVKEKQLESNCRIPMVAFLLRNGKPITYGVNKKGYRGSSIHAEMDCLKKVRFQKRRAKNATMFIARFMKNGKTGLAKPCSNCLEILKTMGIKSVAWTTRKQTVEIARIEDIDTDYLTRPCANHGAEPQTGLDNFSDKGK